MKVFISQSARSTDSKLDALKEKLAEAKSGLKEAKSEFTKAERAYRAAMKALERAEDKQAKAELALGSYNSKAGNVKLPVVGQIYKVRQYGTPTGTLVKPGAEAPKKWNDLGEMRVVSIERDKLIAERNAQLGSGKIRRLFKVSDIGSTVKFVKV